MKTYEVLYLAKPEVWDEYDISIGTRYRQDSIANPDLLDNIDDESDVFIRLPDGSVCQADEFFSLHEQTIKTFTLVEG